MDDENSFFPFEFYLVGTPVSSQGHASSKERWKVDVADAARQRVIDTVEWVCLDDRPLQLTIYYFPIAPMVGDVDNIIKPIMDALKSVAYLDDQVVERVIAQKLEPEVGWMFAEPSEQLAAALDAAADLPVVYVRIDDDLSWRRL